MVYNIKISWDPEAVVWIATSEDIPGLVLECEALDALIERVNLAAPEIIKINRLPDASVLHYCC